jgi:hypothetical protein
MKTLSAASPELNVSDGSVTLLNIRRITQIFPMKVSLRVSLRFMVNRKCTDMHRNCLMKCLRETVTALCFLLMLC